MYENRNVHAIVCIRMGSSRLHGKAMLNLGGKRVVDILHHRISKSKYVDKIIFAMPDAIEDEYLVEYCNSQGYDSRQYENQQCYPGPVRESLQQGPEVEIGGRPGDDIGQKNPAGKFIGQVDYQS